MSMQPITDVSDNLLKSETLVLQEIRELVIPAPQPLSCEIYYKAVRLTEGKVISLDLGDVEIGSISFGKEMGLKRVQCSVPQISGHHGLRVRCIVARLPFEFRLMRRSCGSEAVGIQ